MIQRPPPVPPARIIWGALIASILGLLSAGLQASSDEPSAGSGAVAPPAAPEVAPAAAQPGPAGAPPAVVPAPDAGQASAVAAAGPPAPSKESGQKAAPPLAAKEKRGLLKLGATLTERGDYAAAEIAFRQVLNSTEFPVADQKEALIGMARMFRLQGALSKAAAIYEKFLKVFPDDDRVPDLMLELGRTQRAAGAYRLAVKQFYSVINSTLKLPPQGFEHYEQLAKTAQFEIAETHFAAGDFTEASKYFSRLRLLDLAPADRARAHFKSAYAQFLDNDFEGAVVTLRNYLDQWTDDENVPEARYLLAAALRRLNRTQEALAATLELLRGEKTRTAGDPKLWSYWQRRTGNQLANEFFMAGDNLSALAIYERLAALSPDPAWRLPVTYQIAVCQERLHQVRQARAAYQDILDTVKGTAGGKAAAPNPEFAELTRMAEWGLAHLDWRDQTAAQLSQIFQPIYPTSGVGTPATPPSPSHDAAGSNPATSKTM
jgi:TolA-binding protein